MVRKELKLEWRLRAGKLEEGVRPEKGSTGTESGAGREA